MKTVWDWLVWFVWDPMFGIGCGIGAVIGTVRWKLREANWYRG